MYLQVTVQVGNLPMEEFDCVFEAGTTPITAQAVRGSSNTVTCTLNGVSNNLFTDTGMYCMYLLYD